MYKIVWDTETGGVKFLNRKTENCLSVSPRPVFFEELDLLGLNRLPGGKSWKYPNCKEPLLWACNKQYFYRGKFVFEAKGANIYEKPKILLQADAESLVLTPVNVSLMLERCRDEMFLLESEAIEFIRDTYQMYSSIKLTRNVAKANQMDFEKLAAQVEKMEKKKMAIVLQDCNSFDIMPLESANAAGKKIFQTTSKIDVFLASFSGGKDSQVVLDLCTRALPPSTFEVIYSDTGYELPPSLALYDEVQKYYNKRFPELKFRTAKNHASVLEYWDKIGTPSDTHRWCCSVMKTAPLYRLLKTKENKQARVLTFDGIRAEESTSRSMYNRIGKGVKHDTVINASPILLWNTTEIFLYILKYKLPVNCAYRQGMTRVGCLICPFSSKWNDMISNNKYKSVLKPFLSRIEEKVKSSGIKDSDIYIKNGNWKRRAGGRGIDFPSSFQVMQTSPDLVIKVQNPQQNIFTFLKAVAPFQIQKISEFEHKGEIKYQNSIYAFSTKSENNVTIVKLESSFKEPILQGLFKRAISKATFCIKCEACEVECPTGALAILPSPSIEQSKCISCHKCLTFHERGCIVAHSVAETETNTKKMKLISYNNFGLREEWLDLYIANPEFFFQDEANGLNKKEQEPSFAKWLTQAGIINSYAPKDRELTSLGKLLVEIYQNDPSLVWEIIWINLTYNSPIAIWFKESINWNREFSKPDLVELLKNDYPDNSTKTIENVVSAFFDTLRKCPIGGWGILTEFQRLKYRKNACARISREAIAYSLYKYAEETGSYNFRVSDFYFDNIKSGIYKEFGISKQEFEMGLRSLNSDKNRLVIAELQMGLDHISLRDDISSELALKTLFSF